MTNATTAKNFRSRLRTATRLGVACLCVSIVGGGGASAYIGESFVGIPDLVSGWKGKESRIGLRSKRTIGGRMAAAECLAAGAVENRCISPFPLRPAKEKVAW